jgi:hypothetical protein
VRRFYCKASVFHMGLLLSLSEARCACFAVMVAATQSCASLVGETQGMTRTLEYVDCGSPIFGFGS